jgi:ABC-type transporter MlaC component
MKYWLISGVLLTALSIGMAQQPDNTKMNQQAQPSADQAKNGKSDIKMAAQIRREIVKDKSLSYVRTQCESNRDRWESDASRTCKV